MNIILLLFLAAPVQAAIVGVIYKPDGKVLIAVPSKDWCARGESEAACAQRFVAAICPRDAQGACLPSDVVDDSTLPPRSKRNKWRGNKQDKVRVDNTVVTRADKIANAEAIIDAELEKSTPDHGVIERQRRKIEKIKDSGEQ